MIGLGLAVAFVLGAWGTHVFGLLTGLALYGEGVVLVVSLMALTGDVNSR